jgi:hypothetical protein
VFFLLISFYFFVFILPGIGIIFGLIGLKNKISNKHIIPKKRNNRFCIYGIISIIFIIFSSFFPIHTVLSLKYSKPESLLNYFEKNFDCFENYSFGYMPYIAGISWCRLGKERTPNEKYDGYMVIELEYRIGTLFNIYPEKKFDNIIVYSENDIITNNPRSELFKKIEPTSHENWYFVYVTDDYVYF